jgi:hypothetical protein
MMRIADVHFYFCLEFGGELHPLAMVTLFLRPDDSLLAQSSDTVYLCDRLEGHEGHQVIPIKSIKSVVSMFPDYQVTEDGDINQTNKFSLLRHPFIDLAEYRPHDLFNDDDNSSEDNNSTNL